MVSSTLPSLLASLLVARARSEVSSPTAWAHGLWASPPSPTFDPRESPEVRLGGIPGDQVRGFMNNFNWAELEPGPAAWEWHQLDKQVPGPPGGGHLTQLLHLAELGLGLGLKVYTGKGAPAWLYQAGVPEVKMADNPEASYPYYPDPVYQEYYFR